MALPRILIAVPLIVAGAFLPAASHVTVKAPPGAIGMGHEVFTTEEIQIHRGETLMFVNDSGATFLVLGSLALGATLAFAWAQARTDP